MRSEFVGYYSPTDEQYKHLWTEGLIVLDTNVLLDLYRLPASARDELIAVLESFKERLWVPYQVALEFQRRRLTVIAGERKATEETLSGANALFDGVKEKVEKLQIERRGLGIDVAPLLDELKGISEKLVVAIDAAHNAQLDIAISDPIRDKLDLILAKCIGRGPAGQQELDQLVEGGAVRYENSIPPGYADADKDKNPKEATFYHDGMCYPRKFGDLILWRQLVQHVKENELKYILLITSDRKEDWWWKEKGKTIGPRPELSREIIQQSKAEIFWMYSSAQFLETSKSYTKVAVTDNSVNELREVSRIDFRDRISKGLIGLASGASPGTLSPAPTNVSSCVRKWLTSTVGQTTEANNSPQYRVFDGEIIVGYDYVNVGTIARISRNIKIAQALTNGQSSLRDGTINRFGLILLIDYEDAINMDSFDLDIINNQLAKMSDTYINSDMILGYIDNEFVFVPILIKRG